MVAEAESLTWHVGDQCFTKPKAGFGVNLIIVHVCWVGGVDDISIFCRDNSLDENGHKDLVEMDTELLNRKESPFIELTSPDLLD